MNQEKALEWLLAVATQLQNAPPATADAWIDIADDLEAVAAFAREQAEALWAEEE